MCIEGWRKYNPNYEIIILSKTNYKNYVDIPEELVSHPNFNDSHARFSDLMRIWTVTQNGGVWIDASIIIKQSLDEWIIMENAVEFCGFYLEAFTSDKPFPVIESWFFACKQNSKFMELWKNEFSEIAKFENVDEYIKSRREIVNFQNISSPNYLAIHIAVQKVLQVDKYPVSKLALKKAENGPYKYLVETNWDSYKGIELACANKSYQYPLLKLRGREREILEENIDDKFSQQNCGWTT